MSVSLNRVIIHELVKEQHQAIQPSNIMENVLSSSNPTVIKLVTDIVNLYGTHNNNAHYGTFGSNATDGTFPPDFTTYAESSTLTDQEFINLTDTAMTELYRSADGRTSSSGGYILFADYHSNLTRFFLIAMIKQKEGIRLSEQLVPEELIQLDLNRLHQAARINFSKWNEYHQAEENERQEINYLSFISQTNKRSASGYFVTALGCAQGTASTRATKTLIDESTRFFRENEKLAPRRIEFKESLVEYLSEKEEAGESVKLSEIETLARQFMPAEDSEEADELANEFVSHLNSEENAVPVEFPVSRTSLRKYTHISCKASNWDIKFERGSLGSTDSAQIYYNSDQKSITIKELPDALVQKINEALSERNEE